MHAAFITIIPQRFYKDNTSKTSKPPRNTYKPDNEPMIEVDDEGDVHRSTPCHLHLVAAPKTMPP
jgi:hypothetical protein